MDNSNKAIAKRINNELKRRGWKQTDLLKEIIKYKNPNISKSDIYLEVQTRKGNFSTELKASGNRAIPKEELYIISKILGVSLEYIWFGEEKKSGFIPTGARYAAYQDSENEYRSYFASLEDEDRSQYPDEFGFNLFNYFGQFDSINGYRFFEQNYNLHFDYVTYHELVYVNSEGYVQTCCLSNENYLASSNLIRVLAKYKDNKTFRTIFFDNCSLKRFDPYQFYRGDKKLFDDEFFNILLNNSSFFELILCQKEIDLHSLSERYNKGEKRHFIEPMFFEALDYALNNETNFEEQLSKMLDFALKYNESQYEFIRNYLNTHKDERSDIRIDPYSPRFLKNSRELSMGNVVSIKGKSNIQKINNLINEIEQLAFNMTHIINDQEKTNELIKISTPDNQLFMELHKNAFEQNVNVVPVLIHADKEFTYFKYFESNRIDFENAKLLQQVLDCLEKAQKLVEPKTNKVLVHGNLSGAVVVNNGDKEISISGWQKCHYGSKYEDRIEILTNVDIYSYGDEYLEKFKTIFDVVSKGFSEEEQVKLIDSAISSLNEKRKSIHPQGKADVSIAYSLKQRTAKLEFFKEQYLEK